MALSDTISNAITGGRSQAFLSDGIFDVLFDAVIEFTENDSYTVTRHTIEDGADISDHIKSNPKVIEISAIITDDDWDLLDPFSFFDETIEDRFEILELWKDEKPLLTYFGHETDIEDVVISDVTKIKNTDVGKGWIVNIQLTVVTISYFLVAPISLSAVTAKGAASKGTVQKASDIQVRKASILSRIGR